MALQQAGFLTCHSRASRLPPGNSDDTTADRRRFRIAPTAASDVDTVNLLTAARLHGATVATVRSDTYPAEATRIRIRLTGTHPDHAVDAHRSSVPVVPTSKDQGPGSALSVLKAAVSVALTVLVVYPGYRCAGVGRGVRAERVRLANAVSSHYFGAGALEVVMLVFLIVLLVLWLILTIVGFAIKGLLWLAIIGIVLFVGTAAIGAVRRRALRR
jgi:hypothetical protein